MVFGRLKKSEIKICPQCKKPWDLYKLGRKERMARKLVLMGETASFMGKSFLNPFSHMLPLNDPESWCNLCLRNYMGLDNLKFDLKTLGMKPKEKKNNGLPE